MTMFNPMDFTGKVALVTGAATGMGLATIWIENQR